MLLHLFYAEGLCFGRASSGITGLQCPATTVAAVVASCEASGCSAQQCAASAFGATPTCNSNTLQVCGTSLQSCLELSPLDPVAVCVCRGTYDKCVAGVFR